MPTGRKRKAEARHGRTKKSRPAAISSWEPVHVAEYLTACHPDAERVAKRIQEEGITGRMAMNLTEEALGTMTTSLGQCKSAHSALQDLKHPLMPAFIEMDTDQSNTISSGELAHVLTRVHKRLVGPQEAAKIIKEADVDNSGEVDFQEFKQILESDGSHDHDWVAAAQAVGAPQSLLNGALAFRDQTDQMLSRTQSAIRSGSGFAHGNDKFRGLMIPGVCMRWFVIGWVSFLPEFFMFRSLMSLCELVSAHKHIYSQENMDKGWFYTQSKDNSVKDAEFSFVYQQLAPALVIGLPLAIFLACCLWPRGQEYADWIFGTQRRSYRTGEPVGFGGMLWSWVIRLVVFFWPHIYPQRLNADAFIVVCWVPWLCVVQLGVAILDPLNRNMIDKLLGHVYVYRPATKDAQGRHLYNAILE